MEPTCFFCTRVELCSDSRHRHRRVFAQPSRLRGVYRFRCFMILVSFYHSITVPSRFNKSSMRMVRVSLALDSTKRLSSSRAMHAR